MVNRSFDLKLFSTLGLLFVFMFASQGVFAASCKKELKAAEDSVFKLDTARSTQQAECGDLRLCKSECKLLKKECKTTAKVNKNACKSACNDLSGSKKRLCKSDCRSGIKVSKASCNNVKKQCKGKCRKGHKKDSCKSARQATSRAFLASIRAGEKFISCQAG